MATDFPAYDELEYTTQQNDELILSARHMEHGSKDWMNYKIPLFL